MCTVSFLPVNKNSFLLTHNRDEHVNRGSAFMPKLFEINSNKIIYPKDAKAHGTWISTSKKYSLCLLNGGFEKHKQMPPYRHSRGKIILDFFTFPSFNDFVEEYNFHQIEPFTLIIIEHSTQEISECVWTGDELFFEKKDYSKPQFWCSSTLYSKENKAKRKNWFDDFISKNINYSQDDIIKFHLSQPQKNEEGIQINRNGILKTVSLTSISNNKNKISMFYHDLIENKNKRIEL